MNIIPAIDLIGGKAVRLVKGDYDKVTVYNDDPVAVAKEFELAGAKYLHVVDLDGAKDGTCANFDTIKRITENTSLSVEVGGGIRTLDRVKSYIDIGVDRVIIGTAAVTDPEFLSAAVNAYGEKIVVGVDIKDGYVAIKGWLETSALSCFDFCQKLEELGVKTIICTDISKDGMMSGTNRDLYRELYDNFEMNIIASGGVSSEEDIVVLANMDIFGAIVGKALYTGALELSKCITLANIMEEI
ncbi:MAG: 1-(5-phosphoribosyl)-5-[(5-phosphoribosylamino)methylideneamino]imidazole-4-carboxamide isomerase [Ruminococcaceae bacterium]|nr:1-(5-phosphoribosyl)-5-[(5-phosphoribosylamino)methylideneamino]imidazole-4-carboxamide isomerase [Oscillospiraceae bacterium]